MTAKASTKRTAADRIKQTKRDTKKLYAVSRIISSGVAQQSGIGSGFGSGSNIGRGQFLPTAGGEMQGPIGFFPKSIPILTDEIDITEGGQTNGYSSSVLVTAETGSTDDLETITGGRFAGQLLFIQTQPSETITLKATDNIDTIGGGDYKVDPDEEVLLKYSLTSDVWKQLTHAQTIGADLQLGGFNVKGVNELHVSSIHDRVEPVSNFIDFTSGDIVIHTSDESNDVIIEALGTSADVIINSQSSFLDLQSGGVSMIQIVGGGVTFSSVSAPIFNDDIIYGPNWGEYNDTSDGSVPTPSSGNRRIYYSSDEDALSVKDSAGVVHNLESAGGSGANVNLSNLSSVAVNVSIDPDADGTLDLGSGALSWNDVNLDRILFRHNNGILSTLASIGRSSNSLVLNTPTTEQIFLQVGGTDEYFFDALGLNIKSLNSINFLSTTDVEDIQISHPASSFQIKNNTAIGGFIIDQEATIPSLILKGNNSADGTLAHEIIFQGFDVGGSLTRDYGSIKVRQIVTGTGVEDAGMEFRVMEGGTFDTLYLHLNAQAQQAIFSKDIFFNSGVNLVVNANFAQFDDKTDASVGSPGTGIRRVYYSTDSDSMVVKDSAGVVHDLESGGSQTPWLTNIDADGKDLNDMGSIFLIDELQDIGTNTVKLRELFVGEVQFHNDGTNKPSGGVNEITADTAGLFLGVDDVGDFLSIYHAGVETYRFEEDTLTFMANDHEISTSGTFIKIIADAAANTVQLQSGTGRSNENVKVADAATTFLTSNTSTLACLINLIQNNTTPANGRTIGNIDFVAEDSASSDEIYGRISVSSQDVSSTSKDGLLQLGVMSNNSLAVGMDIEGSASGVKIGFFGATPVVQQSPAASASAIITALETLGLFV